MKKLNIWFNRSFSTTYHFINLIKHNNENRFFNVYGSHINKESIYLSLCDHSFEEPILHNEEYIDYCIQTCKEHNIEVLIPGYKNLFNIASNLDVFEKEGIKVLTSKDTNYMKITEDKIITYQEFKKNNICEVPEYRVVTNAEEFKQAYQELTEQGLKVCLKPAITEGGTGFRIIDQNSDSFGYVTGGMHPRITFEQTYKALQEKETFDEIIVSEYLDGYEYSIDCLAYQGKLLCAVPRKKMSNRIRFLEENQELLDIAQRFNDVYKPDYIFNVQVRYTNGVPKLLEVNPRMSGGLQHSCLSGVNMPYQALKILLGEEVEELKPRYNITSGEVESPVVLYS